MEEREERGERRERERRGLNVDTDILNNGQNNFNFIKHLNDGQLTILSGPQETVIIFVTDICIVRLLNLSAN